MRYSSCWKRAKGSRERVSRCFITRAARHYGQPRSLALAIAHRGYVLQTGEVVLSGSADSLRQNETVRKAYLGED